jgi:hypothetical protein
MRQIFILCLLVTCAAAQSVVVGSGVNVGDVNAQTGTSYTVVAGDQGKLVTFNNASAVAVTLPQATGQFGAGWFVTVRNYGAGTVTITPTTSTIDGGATVTVATDAHCFIYSDGTNYKTTSCAGSAGGGSPGGSGSEIQARSTGTTFQAVTGSSTSSGNITLAAAKTLTLTGSTSGTVALSAPVEGPAQTTTITCLPNDPSQICIADEFIGSGVTSGNLGSLGWGVGGVGSPTATYQSATTSPNIGSVRLSTGSTTSGDSEAIFLDGNNALGLLANLGGRANWQLDFWFKIGATGNLRFRAGVGDTKNTAAASNGFFVRYDTNLSDTTFKYEVRNGGTPVTIDTTITADTNWHRIRIRSTTSGTILFRLYDSTGAAQTVEKSICASSCDATSTIPTSSMIPHVIIMNDGVPGSARTLDLDRFSYMEWGLSR